VIESIPPDEARRIDNEGWRRRLMAQDRTGELGRALIAAREAVNLAWGPVEEYQAREWLALMDCDAGQHQDELRQARRLVKLEPRNLVSLTSLRRAAECNHLWALARDVDAQLEPLLRGAKKARLSAPYGPPSAGEE
jgi:hypothetical protein